MEPGLKIRDLPLLKLVNALSCVQIFCLSGPVNGTLHPDGLIILFNIQKISALNAEHLSVITHY